MSIAQEIADQLVYKESQRRLALATIMDSLRIMHESGRIAEHHYLYALEWIKERQ